MAYVSRRCGCGGGGDHREVADFTGLEICSKVFLRMASARFIVLDIVVGEDARDSETSAAIRARSPLRRGSRSLVRRFSPSCSPASMLCLRCFDSVL